jgi:hypothetical protein
MHEDILHSHVLAGCCLFLKHIRHNMLRLTGLCRSSVLNVPLQIKLQTAPLGIEFWLADTYQVTLFI